MSGTNENTNKVKDINNDLESAYQRNRNVLVSGGGTNRELMSARDKELKDTEMKIGQYKK